MQDVIKKLITGQAPAEEMTDCMGLILGLYRYEHESKSEFREWSVDIPVECAGDRLREWRERG